MRCAPPKPDFRRLSEAALPLQWVANRWLTSNLLIGQAEQTVNVEALVSQVETATAAVSSLVNQTQMRELPLNGRNYEQLILLAPARLAILPASSRRWLAGRRRFRFRVRVPKGMLTGSMVKTA